MSVNLWFVWTTSQFSFSNRNCKLTKTFFLKVITMNSDFWFCDFMGVIFIRYWYQLNNRMFLSSSSWSNTWSNPKPWNLGMRAITSSYRLRIQRSTFSVASFNFWCTFILIENKWSVSLAHAIVGFICQGFLFQLLDTLLKSHN